MNTPINYFWKKKSIFYFILGIYVVFGHIGGATYYKNADILIPNTIDIVIDFFTYPSLMLTSVKGFFFFSGFIFFRNGKCKEIHALERFKKSIHRILRLTIPYVVWNIIYCIFTILLDFIPLGQDGAGGGRDHFVWSMTSIIKGFFLYDYNAHFWYVFQLIIFMTISIPIFLLIQKKYIGIALCALLYYLFSIGVSLRPFLVYEQDALFFFVFGSFLGYHFFDFFTKCFDKRFSFIMLIITLIVWMSAPYINIPIEFELFRRFLFFISIWFSLDLFESWINKTYWFGWNSAFFIYASHGIIQPIIGKILWLFLPRTGSMALIFVFATFFITYSICLSISYILSQKKCFKTIWKIIN